MMVEVRVEDRRTKVEAGVVDAERVRGRLDTLRGGVWVTKVLGVCTLAISVCDMDCGRGWEEEAISRSRFCFFSKQIWKEQPTA